MRFFHSHLLIALALVSSLLGANAQSSAPAYEPNQLLVQLHAEAELAPLLKQLAQAHPDLHWEAPQRLVPHLNLWWLRYQGTVSAPQLLEQAWQSPLVEQAQLNHRVHLRSPQATVPNDPQFNSQWQYINTGGSGGTAGVDMDADDAWDITTGGVTANGDTIVVAVIDNGINLNHPDWGDNLWQNRAEIPNNNIDDDNNGYVDDYLGWNSNTATDNVSGGTHGTSVAGIIGAQGNNGIGVTGVNWDVKMMIIRNDFNTTEANVLIAYGYALTQRRRYNQTNGAEGAYVVVTNASWGVDRGQPSDAPLWCAFYDTLGAAGILNVAATTNNNFNVDVDGDLPTTCTSDYLITVTNVTRAGLRLTSAGYGAQSIDLGAFGADVFTCANSGYGNFGGTSGASPHVAGAVALLHAGACNNFADYALLHPADAALQLKTYILNGVVGTNDLNGSSVSGGYLNLHNSLLLSLTNCPSNTCFKPAQVTTDSVTDSQAFIHWQVGNATLNTQYRFRSVGGTWSSMIPLAAGQQNVQLIGLVGCTNYELELVSQCASGINSDTARHTFKTDGCCEAPTNVTPTLLNSDSVQVAWSPVLAATQYNIEYRLTSNTAWTTLTSFSNSVLISGLQPCQNYEVRVNSICNGSTIFGTSVGFTSLGCTTCVNINYCAASGGDSSQDWIKKIGINNYEHLSGDDGGYLLVGNTNIQLGRGDQHRFIIKQGATYAQRYKVWVDLNQDGDFLDAQEEVLSGQLSVGQDSAVQSFILPSVAMLGPARLRVSMRWRNDPPTCDTFDLGEVQDYCVTIIEGINVDRVPDAYAPLLVAPNPFDHELRLSMLLEKPTPLTVELINTTGQVVHQRSWAPSGTGIQSFTLHPDLPTGVYWLRVYSMRQQWVEKVVKQ